MPNQNFLLPLLNLLLVPLSHLFPLGLNNLILKGEGSPRVRKWWRLEGLVLPVKRRFLGH